MDGLKFKFPITPFDFLKFIFFILSGITLLNGLNSQFFTLKFFLSIIFLAYTLKKILEVSKDIQHNYVDVFCDKITLF